MYKNVKRTKRREKRRRKNLIVYLLLFNYNGRIREGEKEIQEALARLVNRCIITDYS